MKNISNIVNDVYYDLNKPLKRKINESIIAFHVWSSDDILISGIYENTSTFESIWEIIYHWEFHNKNYNKFLK